MFAKAKEAFDAERYARLRGDERLASSLWSLACELRRREELEHRYWAK